MTLYGMAGDSPGKSWPVEVPVWTKAEIECIEARAANLGLWMHGEYGPPQPVPEPGPEHRIPNPAITQTCEACGGNGGSCILIHDGSPHGREFCKNAQWRDCPDCDGLGYTFTQTVRVAERVRVVGDLADVLTEEGPWPKVLARESGFVFLCESWTSEEHDITHLWPEEPCLRGHFTAYNGKKWHLSGAPCPGTIRILPKPDEVWEIGFRTCKLHDVVTEDNGLDCIIVSPGEPFAIMKSVAPDGSRVCRYVSAQFATTPNPGEKAGICSRELYLYDKAVRCDGVR